MAIQESTVRLVLVVAPLLRARVLGSSTMHPRLDQPAEMAPEAIGAALIWLAEVGMAGLLLLANRLSR